MTGEMHPSEVTREAWPIHFAIADATGGVVRPFDHYQGPYVAICRSRSDHGHIRKARKIWLCWIADGFARLYDEITDRQSRVFPYCEAWAPDFAVSLVADIRHWHKIKRD